MLHLLHIAVYCQQHQYLNYTVLNGQICNFPFRIFIHNHLVPCGTHSSLGVDILAPLHRCCEEDSPILFTVAVWGVRVYFKSPCIIEPGAGI